MARLRAPKPSAIACAIARILGMGASVVLLANLIYESVNWGKTLGLSITAVRRRMPVALALSLLNAKRTHDRP